MHRRTRILSGSAALTGLALAAGCVLAAPSNAATGRTTLSGSRPAWAQSTKLQKAAATTDAVNIRVYLNWRNQAQAQATALAIATPGSASYHHYLTPAQFRQQFAPAQADVGAVQQFLKSSGFTIVDTPSNNHYVSAEGTVAQAQAAFGTTLGLYTTNGKTLRAPESDVSVPSSLGAVVQGVTGLDQSSQLLFPTDSVGNDPKQNHGAPGVGFRAGQPCSLWFGEKTVSTPNITAYGTKTKPLAPCGYTPAQVRGLYGLDSVSADGTGQTVAFVGANASPTLKQDVTAYSAKHNLPAPSITEIVAPGIYKHPDTPQQVPGDYYGEETLDAEAIHTTAPGAQLLYVASANAREDFDASINHIVDRGLSHIISISYGFSGEGVPQGYINSLNNTFVQAVAEGIGVYVSSGDNGDEVSTYGSPQVDFYADSPFVTAVGGTSASIVPSGTTPAGATYADVDDASSVLNQRGAWKRSFEVGWQTGYDPITKTASDHITSAPYVLNGTLSQPLPGTFFGGGGGGISKLFAQPSYQQGVTTGAGRALPDISALGDPNTGFLVGQTQQFSNGTYYDEYRIGGTSVAAPLTAGIAAVADQVNGSPLGFLNPRIYAAYKAGTGAFYDVDQADLFGTSTSSRLPSVVRVNYVNSENASGGLSYSLRTLEEPNQTLHSTRGYDTATGVGTPNGSAFFTAITKG
ncbi:S53 family peptidase [Amnibacterium sp. CER49]|uniref:S53 family peptidase n=1 Tax=Amnibacterium sp. CER49 TaxID=3039161 RepID=UPI00244D62B7|nr:S53 family peptidase [Amnibacterium sp. CER49]MDH2445441.1 S53 family peptidase [Amnibacterium sp. CER49]